MYAFTRYHNAKDHTRNQPVPTKGTNCLVNVGRALADNVANIRTLSQLFKESLIGPLHDDRVVDPERLVLNAAR